MRLFLLAAVASAALASPAIAQSPFDGTWAIDLSTAAITAKPERILLKNGVYSCASCTPAYSVKADGAFHPVTGRDYWDATAVTVVDDHAVRHQFRLRGKVIAEATQTVSADGKTRTDKYTNTNNGAGTEVTSGRTAARLAAAPAGTHAVSGSWAVKPPTDISDSGKQLTMKVDGNRVQTSSLGESLDATIGGAFAPNVGDPGKTMTKVTRVGPRALRFTDQRSGKIVNVATYTVSADGSTLTGTWRDPQDGTTGRWTARKQ